MSARRSSATHDIVEPLGPAAGLTDLLDLIEIDTDLFLGRQPDTTLQRVFGGQVAAQALVAGARTAGAAREVHSLHSYFLRPGDYSTPIVYDVERLRDGRSFSTRRVTARQHGKPIYTQLLSLHEPEEGFSHQSVMPVVRSPNAAAPFADVMERRGNPLAPSWRRVWDGLDVRWLEDSRQGLARHQEHRAMVRLWIRVADELPADPVVHAAAFTYASDISLLGSTLVAHDFAPGRVHAASLDHSIWFHRPFASTDWWLYDQVSPAAQAGRGFARGSVYTIEGTAVASVAQEVLIRRVSD